MKFVSYAYGNKVLPCICLLCIMGVTAAIGPSRTPTRTPSHSPLSSVSSSPSATPSITPSVTPTPTPTPTPSISPASSLTPSTTPHAASQSASAAPNPTHSPASSTLTSTSPLPSVSTSSLPSSTTTPSTHATNTTTATENNFGTVFILEIVVPSVSGVILIGGILYFLKKRKQAKNMVPDIKFQEFQEHPGPIVSPAELSQKTIGIFLDGNFVYAIFLGRSGKPLVRSVPCMLLYDKILGAFMFDGNLTDESEVALEILRLIGEDEETIEKVTKKWWGANRPVQVSRGCLVLHDQEYTVSEVLAKILGQLFSENAQDMENFDHCLVVVPAFVYFNTHKKQALIDSFDIALGEKCHVDIVPEHRIALEPHQHENGTVFVSLTSFGMEVVKKNPDGSIFGSFVDYGTRDVAYKLWKNSRNSWSSLWKTGCDITWFEKQIQDLEAVIRKHVVDENAAKAVCDVDTSDLEKVMGGYNECIRKILILASCAHVIDFSTFSFQPLLKSHTMDTIVKMDKLQLSEFLDLILFRCVDFQSNAS